MQLAGMILDIYDDPNGSVLREKIAESGRQLPDKLASSTLLSHSDKEALPNRLFALVASNGGELVRKYAMHDEPHLVTSLIYFTKCGERLPEQIKQKVASNLVQGCSWYGITPPDTLLKTAGLGKAVAGLGILDAASRAKEEVGKNNQLMERFRQAQAAGLKVAGRTVEISMDQDAAIQRGEGQSHIMDLFDEFSDHAKTHKKLEVQLEKLDQPEASYSMDTDLRKRDGKWLDKKADLTGTEIMPHGAMKSAPHRIMPGKKPDQLPQKVAWQYCGDISGLELEAVKQAMPTYQHFALSGHYPIDTAEQVKKAEAYFEEHYTAMPVEDRRVFAQNVVLRAEELGTVKVSGTLLSYSGNEYGPFLESELLARIKSFEGTGDEAVYEVLYEKRAEIDPMIMSSMLFDADRLTGADNAYGRPGVGFLDPYAAVYGRHKLAEADLEAVRYSWSRGNDYASGESLETLAKTNTSLDEMFGKGFGNSFRADPIGVFKSMPDPQKVVLSRLAAKAAGSSNGL